MDPRGGQPVEVLLRRVHGRSVEPPVTYPTVLLRIDRDGRVARFVNRARTHQGCLVPLTPAHVELLRVRPDTWFKEIKNDRPVDAVPPGGVKGDPAH